MYAIRSYYVGSGREFRLILNAHWPFPAAYPWRLGSRQANNFSLIHKKAIVITSYSIHYTKLYEGANKATITVKLNKVPVELSENYVDPLTGITDTNGYIYKGRNPGTLDYSENVNEFLIGRIV